MPTPYNLHVCRPIYTKVTSTHISHGSEQVTQQTRDLDPMLGWCWATGFDAGPAPTQHRIKVWCLLGSGEGVYAWMYANAHLACLQALQW